MPRRLFRFLSRRIEILPAWLQSLLKPIAVYCPAATLLLGWSLCEHERPAWRFAVLPLLGLAFWTLFEYCLHAAIFHGSMSTARLRAWQHELHIQHHVRPDDDDHIVSRLSLSMPIACILFGGLTVILASVHDASLVMVGIIAGYLWYEIVHCRIHKTRDYGRFMRTAASRHLHHHFTDPQRCFGVTTGFWDVVFCTRKRKRPRRQ